MNAIVFQVMTGLPYQPDQPAPLTTGPDKSTFSILDSVQITLLPCDMDQIVKKSKFHEYFDRVYLSNQMAHRIPDMPRVMKPEALLFAENAKYVLHLIREMIHLTLG